MFSIQNVYNKGQITIRVKHGDKSLDFIIASLIGKARNKEELENDVQFTILNSYCNYKGEEFKQKLFDSYLAASEMLDNALTNPDMEVFNTPLLDGILELFKVEEVRDYLVNEWKLQPPANLLDEFDAQIETDAKGTRIQTYLKEDYIDLAAMSVVIKATLGPVAQFGFYRHSTIDSNYKEYALLQFYTPFPNIYKCKAMVKLLGLIEKLIEQTTTSKDIMANRVLEKFISKDDLGEYVLAIVVLQKISIAPLVNDTAESNIVTKLYNHINNKLKPNGETSKVIKDKTPLEDTDSNTGDKESLLESYRATQDLASGIVVELNFVTETVDRIIGQLPPKQKELVIQSKLLPIAIEASKAYLPTNPTVIDIQELQLNILAIIFKNVIDPRSYDYLEINSLVNLIAVGFVYLWELGFKELALILLSRIIPMSMLGDNSAVVGLSVSRHRIPKELKEELDKVFPYKRELNELVSKNLAEEFIEDITEKLISTYVVKPLVSKEYTEGMDSLPTTRVKISFAEFLIKHEEMCLEELSAIEKLNYDAI